MQNSRRVNWFRAARPWPALLLLVCGLFLLLMVAPAHAAGIVVNSAADTVADDGECTLREAITAANSDTASGAMTGECAAGVGTDAITFAADYTITLAGSQLPAITTEMTITGNGAAATIIQASTCHPVTLPGGCTRATYRVFQVGAAGNLTLDGVTVRHGYCVGGCVTPSHSGGGLYNNGGTVTMTNSTLSDNYVNFNGGGLQNNGGTVTVTNSTLSDNTTCLTCGGLGGGIHNAGAGTVTVTNSTLSGNTTSFGGGGIHNEVLGTVIVTNSTLSGNSSYSFVSGGGGISNYGTATVTNSLFVRGAYGNNCFKTTNAASNIAASNIANDASCGGATQKTTAEIALGPLQDNGGPTHTHALLPGSAAIDFNSSTNCDAAPVNGLDQRGEPRNVDIPGVGSDTTHLCDAGAYEFQLSTLTIAKAVAGSGAPAGWSFAFSGDLGAFNLTDGDDNETFAGLSPGAYSFSETADPGYTTTIDCDNDDSSATGDITVTLAAEDDVTCNVTNTVVPAGLTIVKSVTGSGAPAGWSFGFSGDLGPFSLTDDAPDLTDSDVAPGVVAVNETNPAGYATSASCTNGDSSGNGELSVTLNPGDVVSCTFTNTICQPGFFDTAATWVCSPAGAGYFVDTTGAAAQTACAPGTWQDQQGQVSCHLADPGYYAPGPAAVAQTACPTGTTSPAGSDSIDDCVPLPPATSLLYIAPNRNNGVVAGVAYMDEDIIVNTLGTADWAMYFDGSDVGITKNLTDFTFTPDDCLLMTFNGNQNVPGVGLVKPQDLVKFCPTATGPTTAGTFTMYFDGSDVGLDAAAEVIDAVEVLPGGDLVISTKDKFSIPQLPAPPLKGQKNDLLRFHGTSYGPTTAGTWSLYFNNTQVAGLKKENIISLYIDGTGDKYVSFWDAYPNVGGVAGNENDILIFHPDNTVTKFWEGSDWGYTGRVHGLHIGN